MTTVVEVTLDEHGILHVTLNRPEVLNALNNELLDALHDAFVAAKQDPKVKAILLTGNGKAFCAGADITYLTALDATAGASHARRGQAMCLALENCGKPSLAAIQGYALGGGCELAMSASIRMAAATAQFAQPEVKLGVIPGFGGTQRLSRLVGKGRALDLCLTGRMIKAVDAYAFGLVTHVVAPEELNTAAVALLLDIIKLPPLALASVMTVIDKGYNLSLTEALELEASHFGLCCATADKAEGTHAFLEKRAAVFQGK